MQISVKNISGGEMKIVLSLLIATAPCFMMGCEEVNSARSNFPPAMPSNPYPPDGVEFRNEYPLLTNFTWSCSDPDDDALTYDVYYKNTVSDSSEHLIGEGINDPWLGVFVHGDATWHVVAIDGQHRVEGPLWHVVPD